MNNRFLVGEKVLIDNQYKGEIVANITLNQYSPDWSKEDWDYLKTGLLISTDSMGLVYYPQDSDLIEIFKDENN